MSNEKIKLSTEEAVYSLSESIDDEIASEEVEEVSDIEPEEESEEAKACINSFCKVIIPTVRKFKEEFSRPELLKYLGKALNCAFDSIESEESEEELNHYEEKKSARISKYREYAGLNESVEITEENLNEWALGRTCLYFNRPKDQVKKELLGKE